MASVCIPCMSAGTELVFDDPNEYDAHMKEKHAPAPVVVETQKENENPATDAETLERLNIVGEALESIQQRIVNLANRIEMLESVRVTDVQRIEQLEAEIAALKNPATPPATEVTQ